MHTFNVRYSVGAPIYWQWNAATNRKFYTAPPQRDIILVKCISETLSLHILLWTRVSLLKRANSVYTTSYQRYVDNSIEYLHSGYLSACVPIIVRSLISIALETLSPLSTVNTSGPDSSIVSNMTSSIFLIASLNFCVSF